MPRGWWILSQTWGDLKKIIKKKEELFGIAAAVDVPPVRQLPAKSFPLMETTPTQSSANVWFCFCQTVGGGYWLEWTKLSEQPGGCETDKMWAELTVTRLVIPKVDWKIECRQFWRTEPLDQKYILQATHAESEKHVNTMYKWDGVKTR